MRAIAQRRSSAARRWALARVAAAAALPLLLAAPPAAAQAAFQHFAFAERDSASRDTAYVDAVIRVEIENGPSAIVPALAYNSTLMLPVHRLFDMAEIHLEGFALRDSAVAVLEPGHVVLRFDPRAGVLTKDGTPVAYDSMDVAWSDGDLFVATGLLDRLLGVRSSVAWADLSVMIGHSAELPVVQRLRRERRHQLLYRPPAASAVLDLPLRRRAVDGAVVSWSLTAATGGPTNQLDLNLGLGADLLGGSAELRPEFWSDHGQTSASFLASWTRVWTGHEWLQQAGLGAVQSGGLHARLLEGATLTNAPFVRSSEFDVEDIGGRVPPGWEVELYDNGRLIGYNDANAVGAFRVPLQLHYGQNPFDLVLYGPSGETVHQTRTIRVPASRLPGGRLEYNVSGGRCRFDPCDGLLSADLRYGLSNHVTLQGGSDGFFSHTRGSLWQPYAVVSAGVLPALGLTGEAVVNGHLRIAADYEPTPDLRANVEHTRYTPSGALYEGAGSLTSSTDASLFWRPGWLRGAVFFQGTGLYSTGPGIHQGVLRLAGTRQVGQVRYSLGILTSSLTSATSIDTTQFAVDASVDALLLGRIKWLRGSTVGAQVGFEPGRGLTALRANYGHRVTQALRLDAAVGWYRVGGMSLELGLTTALVGPQIGTRSRLSAQGGSDALTYTYGSVAWDPRSGLVRLGNSAELDRAGVSGILYRDDNGNGVRDPGEPGLANIPIRIGGWPAQTDSEGRFSAWGLIPFEPVQVDVDSLALPDPRLLLPAPVIQVRPSPNAFGSIEIPVEVGAEVSGFVVMGEQALAGVPVILRDLDSGREVKIQTFADGAFYRAAVPPGDYEVTLPKDVLDRLQAYAPPLSIFVPPGPGDKRFEDLELRLTPRQ
jgi:hypothetical protein